jgi:hypothetical protein
LGVEHFFLPVGVVKPTIFVVAEGVTKEGVEEGLEGVAFGDFRQPFVVGQQASVAQFGG